MILFIDACVKDDSRTRELAEVLIERLNGSAVYLKLSEENLPVLNKDGLKQREEACANKDFSSEVFRYAKQFAEAETVVIAAPYWDLSFPAVLKKYIESICITGITFKYSEEGIPIGMCKADKLYYVTTAGGSIFNTQYGEGYIKMLSQGMFGIKEFQSFKVENLDIRGNDVNEIMREAKQKIMGAQI